MEVHAQQARRVKSSTGKDIVQYLRCAPCMLSVRDTESTLYVSWHRPPNAPITRCPPCNHSFDAGANQLVSVMPVLYLPCKFHTTQL
jgi:hypothetical protein